MAGRPANIGRIACVVLKRAVRRPTVKDWSSDEAEVKRELSCPARRRFEIDVVAMNEYEGVLGWGVGDSLPDPAKKRLFLKSRDLLQHDMLLRVGSEFKSQE